MGPGRLITDQAPHAAPHRVIRCSTAQAPTIQRGPAGCQRRSTVASPDPANPTSITYRDRLREARSYGLSIRALRDLTGVSFGALQGILSGRTQQPREATIERLEAGLANLPVFRTERPHTYADDLPVWSYDRLGNLTPPRGAESFRLVFWSEGTDRRTGSSRPYGADEWSPLDAALDLGADPRSIRRVIWDR